MGNIKEKRLFLLDMDGTIYIDNDLFDRTMDDVKTSDKKPEFIYENIRKIYNDLIG